MHYYIIHQTSGVAASSEEEINFSVPHVPLCRALSFHTPGICSPASGDSAKGREG